MRFKCRDGANTIYYTCCFFNMTRDQIIYLKCTYVKRFFSKAEKQLIGRDLTND